MLLLIGCNVIIVGMVIIEEFIDGFFNCNGWILVDIVLFLEVLVEYGYNIYCVGKWYLMLFEEFNMVLMKWYWLILCGFEWFYGFLGGEID